MREVTRLDSYCSTNQAFHVQSSTDGGSGTRESTNKHCGENCEEICSVLKFLVSSIQRISSCTDLRGPSAKIRFECMGTWDIGGIH